ncbi:YdjY domain-containing protein [Haloferula helveola]
MIFELLLRKQPAGPFRSIVRFVSTLAVGLTVSIGWIAAEETEPRTKDAGDAAKAAKELKLPGLEIDVAGRQVDVDATVCLREGFLELLACTKQTKEHESIVAVEAKPSHIHAALLLLGAKPGNPAIQKRVGGIDGHWVDIAPRGQEIEVYLVFKDEKGEMKEHPVNEFISRGPEDVVDDGGEGAEQVKFPTHSFLFAGSHLYKEGDAPPQYLCDQSGNVISISTFGDELLCLPGVHAKDNGSLVWEVDPTHLPPLDTKVILRLKPKFEEEAEEKAPDAETPEAAEGE